MNSEKFYYYDFVVSEPKETTERLKLSADSPMEALKLYLGTKVKSRLIKLSYRVVAMVEFRKDNGSARQMRYVQLRRIPVDLQRKVLR